VAEVGVAGRGKKGADGMERELVARNVATTVSNFGFHSILAMLFRLVATAPQSPPKAVWKLWVHAGKENGYTFLYNIYIISRKKL